MSSALLIWVFRSQHLSLFGSRARNTGNSNELSIIAEWGKPNEADSANLSTVFGGLDILRLRTRGKRRNSFVRMAMNRLSVSTTELLVARSKCFLFFVIPRILHVAFLPSYSLLSCSLRVSFLTP
jgi:hypothetical protein